MRKGRGRNRKVKEGEKRGRNCIRERRKRRMREDSKKEWGVEESEWGNRKGEKKKSVWERGRMSERKRDERK